MSKQAKSKSRKAGRDATKAVIVVTLKPSVLDPQGMTIQKTISPNGFEQITDVRQGKYFEIRLKNGISKAAAHELLERLGKEVLTNPVTEQYRIV